MLRLSWKPGTTQVQFVRDAGGSDMGDRGWGSRSSYGHLRPHLWVGNPTSLSSFLPVFWGFQTYDGLSVVHGVCPVLFVAACLEYNFFFLRGFWLRVHVLTRERQKVRGKVRNHTPGRMATLQSLLHSPLRILGMHTRAQYEFQATGSWTQTTVSHLRV